MKILIVGSGGREHALAEKILSSTLVSEVYLAPGNAGIFQSLPKIKQVDLKATEVEKITRFAIDQRIDLVVVGPEVSLDLGLVDLLNEKKIKAFGPTKLAAQLECSKSFAKEIMHIQNVPTAEYQMFFNPEQALQFIEKTSMQKMVVKVDGLAAGKGVIVCENKLQACQAIIKLFTDAQLDFKTDKILIEEYLEGPEVSAFAITDGEEIYFLGSACDHKRLLDQDLGPNTGGMGTLSPAPLMTAEDESEVIQTIFKPTLKALKQKNIHFSGILFAGLMKTDKGFKALEFNVRFGDPETQVLLPRIESDLVPYFVACAEKKLKNLPSIKISAQSAVHVVMSAFGYPGTEGVKVRSEDVVTIPDNITEKIYFAGVKKNQDQLLTSGGRVLGVTAVANDLTKARNLAYAAIKQIHFEGSHYRSDIGLKYV